MAQLPPPRVANDVDARSVRSMSSLDDYSDSEGPPNKMMKGGMGSPRLRDGRELIQCPTVGEFWPLTRLETRSAYHRAPLLQSGCDGMGHVSGNYATHRR